MSESSSNRSHAPVLVEVGEQREEIDEMVAPLIREIWIAGLSTANSCQEEYRETAWIEFQFVDELEKFVNIVAEYDASGHSMYARIGGNGCSHAAAKSWSYALSPLDMGNDGEDGARSVNFGFTARAYIPHHDIPILVERLAAYNRRLEALDTQETARSAEMASAVVGCGSLRWAFMMPR